MTRSSLTDVGAVDEAEQIEQEDRWYDVQVDLATEFCLSLGIELDERVAVAASCSVIVDHLVLECCAVLVSCSMASLSGSMCVLMTLPE